MKKQNQDFLYLTAYTIPDGYRGESENIYKWLRHSGLNPEWNFTHDETGAHCTQIMLPENEMSMLHQMQRSNPARFGNAPEVKEQLQKAQADMEALVKNDRARSALLTQDQLNWIETIHYHTHLNRTQCLDLNEKLEPLCADHVALCRKVELDGGDKKYHQAILTVREKIAETLRDLPNVTRPDFQDPSVSGEVKIVFSQGDKESTRIAVINPENIPAMENIDEVIEKYSMKSLRLNITETGNAAFVDVGRHNEIARIVREVAEKIENAGAFPEDPIALFDLNGNRVGECFATTDTDLGEDVKGAVQLIVRGGDAAITDGGANEVASILRGAAKQFERGENIFALHDTNGVLVGKARFDAPASLDIDDRIDMREALRTGAVYLAEEGYSGISDGEYRYVVTSGDYEPGYGDQGEVWLVNAKGEKANGFEDPQHVDEKQFMKLPKDHAQALEDVVFERVSFEDFESKFGDDPEPY